MLLPAGGDGAVLTVDFKESERVVAQGVGELAVKAKISVVGVDGQNDFALRHVFKDAAHVNLVDMTNITDSH